MQKIAMQTLPKPEWTERSYHRKASRSDFPTGFSAILRIAPAAPQLTQFISCIYPETSAPDSSAAFLFSRSGESPCSRAGSARVYMEPLAEAAHGFRENRHGQPLPHPEHGSSRVVAEAENIWGQILRAEKASMINFSYLRYKISGLFMRSFNRRPRSRSSRISEGDHGDHRLLMKLRIFHAVQP